MTAPRASVEPPEPLPGPTRPRLLRLIVGLAVAMAALAVVLRGADRDQLVHAFGQVHPGWIVVTLASVAVTLAIAVARWRLTFFPHHRDARWAALFSALLIGQMLNIVLPFRTGELGRAYALARSQRISTARVLSTIAVERLSDLTGSGTAAMLLLAAGAGPAWLLAPGRMLAIAGALALAVAVILSLSAAKIFAVMLPRIAAVVPRRKQSLERSLQPAVDALSGLRNARVAFSIWLLAMAVTAGAASTNYFLFRAFDLAVPALAALVLVIALQVGTSLVSVPGNLGVFHVVVVFVLTRFSVEQSTAVAYALVLYALAIVPKIVIGGACLALTRRAADR